MISRVRIVRFKGFIDQRFDLAGACVLLAGPNNSGKSTLLHAISAWNLALKRWLAERGEEGGKRRISVVLDEFTALPLREMNLLWMNRHTARRIPGQKAPKPAPIYIEVVDSMGAHVEESLTIEFMYANEKLIYIRPVQSPDKPDPVDRIPAFARAKEFNVVHVPPFSGIGVQEPRHSAGIQYKLVGEGKPGEIVRNLLQEIWETSQKSPANPPWRDLADDIGRLFQCELFPPQFSDATAQPYIVSEYRPRITSNGGQRGPKLDIANAGSGFHQVLLLLAFFYARPSSLLLLDEPDAHLHFILQREIFDHLRSVAQRRSCKLIVATHAEVLLSGSEPDQIISFVGRAPRRLVTAFDKQRLQESLRRLTSLDLIQADHVRAVLYVEDESDYKILREWSKVLNHGAFRFLGFPFVVPLGGKGNLGEAKRHFQCLTMARPELRGLCLLDRDLETDESSASMPAALVFHRWPRYEIENYLLIPDLIKRFLRRELDLFTQREARDAAAIVDGEFAANFPAGIDFLGDLPALRDLKASQFLVNLLAKTPYPLQKRDLYMLAEVQQPAEIHKDVVAVLDTLESVLPPTSPNVEANAAPLDSEGLQEEIE